MITPLSRLAPLLVGCAFLLPIARAEHVAPRETRQPGAEPMVVQVNDKDTAMRAAVHRARQTVPQFVSALQHPAAGQESFSVKKPFMKDGAVEHLWLTHVTFSGNRFHGQVDNRPLKITGLKLGDRVSVNPDEITDWAYVDHGRLMGGFTIRALYRQLAPAQQQEMQHEFDFKISDR